VAGAFPCPSNQKDNHIIMTTTEEITMPDEQIGELRRQRNDAFVERDQAVIERDAAREELTSCRDLLQRTNRELGHVRDQADAAERNHQGLRDRFNILTLERDGLARRLDVEAGDALNELASFKERVVEVAVAAAEEYDWCSVIDSILGRLDLQRPSKSITATLEITVNFTAEMTSRRDEPSTDWVLDCLRRHTIEQAIKNAFTTDSDLDNTEINDVDFDITSVDLDH
jgi:chromosome segregation ATPase